MRLLGPYVEIEKRNAFSGCNSICKYIYEYRLISPPHHLLLRLPFPFEFYNQFVESSIFGTELCRQALPQPAGLGHVGNPVLRDEGNCGGSGSWLGNRTPTPVPLSVTKFLNFPWLLGASGDGRGVAYLPTGHMQSSFTPIIGRIHTFFNHK